MTARMRFVTTVLFSAMLAAACATTPEARFYTLDSGVAQYGGAADSNLSLAIGPIDLPQYLDRPQIVSRDGDNRLDVDEFHRWGGSLDEEIHRVLAAHLGGRLGTQRIYAYPSRIVAQTDYRIALDVRVFDGEQGGDVRLDVAWSLIDDRTAAVVDVRRGLYTAPVTRPGFAGYAEALSGLLGQLAEDLADDITRQRDGGKEKPAARRRVNSK